MDMSRWVVIYPVYINSKKTLAEGRRISTSKACENPTVVEIGDCCQYLKLPCAIEVCMYLSLSLCVPLSSRACFKSLLRILPHATRVCISCSSIQFLLWIVPHATRVCISCYCIQSLLWILPHATTCVCIS